MSTVVSCLKVKVPGISVPSDDSKTLKLIAPSWAISDLKTTFSIVALYGAQKLINSFALDVLDFSIIYPVIGK